MILSFPLMKGSHSKHQPLNSFTVPTCCVNSVDKLEIFLLQLHLLESADIVDYEALEDLISEELVSGPVFLQEFYFEPPWT